MKKQGIPIGMSVHCADYLVAVVGVSLGTWY